MPDPSEPFLVHFEITEGPSQEHLIAALVHGGSCTFTFAPWAMCDAPPPERHKEHLFVLAVGRADKQGNRLVDLASRNYEYRFRGTYNPNLLPPEEKQGEDQEDPQVSLGRFSRERQPARPQTEAA